MKEIEKDPEEPDNNDLDDEGSGSDEGNDPNKTIDIYDYVFEIEKVKSVFQ